MKRKVTGFYNQKAQVVWHEKDWSRRSCQPLDVGYHCKQITSPLNRRNATKGAGQQTLQNNTKGGKVMLKRKKNIKKQQKRTRT
jgi:hypothetical protein